MSAIPGTDCFGRLKRKDAAAALGVAPMTMANWCTAGIGPKAYSTPTGQVFYLATEIRDFALCGVSENKNEDRAVRWLRDRKVKVFSLPCLYMKGPRPVRTKDAASQVVANLLADNRIRRIDGPRWVDGHLRNECYELILGRGR